MKKTLPLKFLGFAFISAIGVSIDFFCVWLAVTFFNFIPFWANALGSTMGIAFVFFTSSYRLFINKGKLIMVKFLVYLAYSALLIFVVSLIINKFYTWPPLLNALQAAHLTFIHPALAVKFLVTPFTLIINFIVAHTLIEKIKI